MLGVFFDQRLVAAQSTPENPFDALPIVEDEKRLETVAKLVNQFDIPLTKEQKNILLGKDGKTPETEPSEEPETPAPEPSSEPSEPGTPDPGSADKAGDSGPGVA